MRCDFSLALYTLSRVDFNLTPHLKVTTIIKMMEFPLEEQQGHQRSH